MDIQLGDVSHIIQLAIALDLALAKFIASLFVLTMLTLIGSFIYLLREIFIATRTLSIRRPSASVKQEGISRRF